MMFTTMSQLLCTGCTAFPLLSMWCLFYASRASSAPTCSTSTSHGFSSFEFSKSSESSESEIASNDILCFKSCTTSSVLCGSSFSTCCSSSRSTCCPPDFLGAWAVLGNCCCEIDKRRVASDVVSTLRSRRDCRIDSGTLCRSVESCVGPATTLST